jgi:hypothetical protein
MPAGAHVNLGRLLANSPEREVDVALAGVSLTNRRRALRDTRFTRSVSSTMSFEARDLQFNSRSCGRDVNPLASGTNYFHCDR